MLIRQARSPSGVRRPGAHETMTSTPCMHHESTTLSSSSPPRDSVGSQPAQRRPHCTGEKIQGGREGGRDLSLDWLERESQGSPLGQS